MAVAIDGSMRLASGGHKKNGGQMVDDGSMRLAGGGHEKIEVKDSSTWQLLENSQQSSS
ncbi:hypothetical protein Csa_008935 [Cucumis sativus]|uniref:Uncharacterized protein n=1 Tax=Cucumis sativus TaxID=3659 RepID=A0A0A0KQ90_CUCSA|nr:hypothetical protein Csa_008935 [Cucumis sativus]